MNFATLQDALTFAMEKEKKANELYLLFRGKVKDEGARTLLQELADQEMGHWRMIREALESGSVEGIAAKAKGRDIQLSDTMIEIDLTPDSTPQDIMVFAMQMEKKALDFYAGLRPVQGHGPRGPVRPAGPRGDAAQGDPGKGVRAALCAVDVVKTQATGYRLQASGDRNKKRGR